MRGGTAEGRIGGGVLAALLLTAYASQLTAQSDPRVDSVFAPVSRTDGPGCVAGVRQGGTTVHLKAYGMANLEYGVPLSTESISESGSVAKQFTAASLVLLAEERKLSLDDDIRKYLPRSRTSGMSSPYGTCSPIRADSVINGRCCRWRGGLREPRCTASRSSSTW